MSPATFVAPTVHHLALLSVERRLELEAKKAQVESELRASSFNTKEHQAQLKAIRQQLANHYRALAQTLVAQAMTA